MTEYIICCLVAESYLALSVTPWTVSLRLLCPWDFPGKNTGVGFHFLLRDPPNPEIELASPELQILLLLSHPGSSRSTLHAFNF